MMYVLVALESRYYEDPIITTTDAEPSLDFVRTTKKSTGALDIHSDTRPSSTGQGKTKIVAFCNYNYRSVAVVWYARMTRLGYSSHVLVATDQEMADFLNKQTPSLRYEVMIHSAMAPEFQEKNKDVRDRHVLQLLMAVRWKYLLVQLEQGTHILLTDVDNIFTRYHSMEQFENTSVDIWHAYATKFPLSMFKKQGFVVCSGMSWWRSSPAAIRFSRLMQKTCGNYCDDQQRLNGILAGPETGMVWDWTSEVLASRLTNGTESDPRYVGLLQKEVYGTSNATGHRAGIWDRDFAYRGRVDPEPCPENNWVSMPILAVAQRSQSWRVKRDSFEVWDKNCGVVEAKG